MQTYDRDLYKLEVTTKGPEGLLGLYHVKLSRQGMYLHRSLDKNQLELLLKVPSERLPGYMLHPEKLPDILQ